MSQMTKKEQENTKKWRTVFAVVGITAGLGLVAYLVTRPLTHTPQGTREGYGGRLYYVSQNPDGSWHAEVMSGYGWAKFDAQTREQVVAQVQAKIDLDSGRSRQ